MKKKILALCLVVVLAVTAVTGATLAYFTDTDVETNTFTIGNVEIDLNENYVQDSELMPGIDVTKEAWIENTGANDAWVWAEILVPAALDDGDDNSPQAPGLGNSLHFNFPGAYSKEYAQNTNANGKWYNADLSKLWIHQHNEDSVSYGFVGTETIGGVVYNKYIALYTEKLAKEAKTSNFLSNVYMDSKVTQCKDTTHTDCMILADGQTEYSGTWEILVRGYAIQAEGFDDVVSAWKAYDGAKPAVDREQTPDNGPSEASAEG